MVDKELAERPGHFFIKSCQPFFKTLQFQFELLFVLLIGGVYFFYEAPQFYHEDDSSGQSLSP